MARVKRSGRVALLLQNPGDYFLHERVDREAPPQRSRAPAWQRLGRAQPRDLSGGERQRLALAIVHRRRATTPAVLALDEPTRGMDREAKAELAARAATRAPSAARR